MFILTHKCVNLVAKLVGTLHKGNVNTAKINRIVDLGNEVFNSLNGRMLIVTRLYHVSNRTLYVV